MSEIRDISLAPSGERKIEWVRRNMPLLRGIEEEFSETQPFKGNRNRRIILSFFALLFFFTFSGV